tara:strand:- start:1964 stop:2482 length:519 start_codon:yes stop_codon:yes gene_type:complete
MSRPLVHGYHPYKMAKFGQFPDSYVEAKVVQEQMKNPDWEYFQLTDKTPIAAFTKYLDANGLEYDPANLETIALDAYPTIIALKDYYNRPRPSQMLDGVDIIKSPTANSPSYPSGHALQSYLLAEYLSRKYPWRRWTFFQIADRVGNSRVSMGLHYPSDNSFAFEVHKWMIA